MVDPLRSLFRSLEPEGIRRIARTPYEQIEHHDRVARAAAIIRNEELALWFEPEWGVAVQIAERCPECRVLSVPAEAILLDNLLQPPPWRRNAQPGRL